MHLGEIVALLENKLSPKSYSIKDDFYGLQFGESYYNRSIKKIMLTLRLTLDSIHHAYMKRVNLIISYRGLINKPILSFNQDLINKLALLSRFPILVFVLNSSFIGAEGGLSDTIMELLYFELDRPFLIKNDDGMDIPVGRICLPKNYFDQRKSLKLEDLLKRIKSNLELKIINFVGDLKKSIHKICVIGGDFSDLVVLEDVLKSGCDCYISNKIAEDQSARAQDLGINLIEIPGYYFEIKTMKKLSNFLSLEFPDDEIFLYNTSNLVRNY
ncbi:MAG: hypothetical protein EU539_01425 [Promethearchaeota archaeon]|nr:MAG: hypothetical protein EU539_01425 [Candidatus Lokiarchaeota archaeon]